MTVKRHVLIDVLPLCPSGVSAGRSRSGQVVTAVSAAKPVTLGQRAGFPPATCVIGEGICCVLVQMLNNWMMGHKGE